MLDSFKKPKVASNAIDFDLSSNNSNKNVKPTSYNLDDPLKISFEKEKASISSQNLVSMKKTTNDPLRPKKTNSTTSASMKNITDPLSQMKIQSVFGVTPSSTKNVSNTTTTTQNNINNNSSSSSSKNTIMSNIFGKLYTPSKSNNVSSTNMTMVDMNSMNMNTMNTMNTMNINAMNNMNMNTMYTMNNMNTMNAFNNDNNFSSGGVLNNPNLQINDTINKNNESLNKPINPVTKNVKIPVSPVPISRPTIQTFPTATFPQTYFQPSSAFSNTGNLNSLSDFINPNSNIPLKKNGQFDYESKIQSTPGDFYSDLTLIRKNCDIMESETIKDITKASYLNPDKSLMGILVLTDFRLIFKFENEDNIKIPFSEDYFKMPLFNIIKIEKVQDKKMFYDAYPLDISLKDTRVIKFHVWDKQKFYFNLYDSVNPRDNLLWFCFPENYKKVNFNNPKNLIDGWTIFDPVTEYSRMGVTPENNLGLRYCLANKDYSLCATYPKIFIEPKEMTDEELKETSKYRTKNRLPIFTYYYNGNKNKENLSKYTPSIWRSAQNKGGIVGSKRNSSDEKLLNIIVNMCGKLYIFDCRPKLNALVNRVNGGGYENVEHYKNVSLSFCEIDNIHKARKSLNSLFSICLSNKINEYNNFWTSLEDSGWFQFVYLLLKNANEISKTLQKNYSVLIHCSDGWDRTAQLSALSQLLLDPFYRTIKGFAILIEKDWLSFGHQFGLRNGYGAEDQRSPIFLQFLDAVHQLLEQYPNAFEFNEEFLLFLAKNYSINLYGTFMYNNEKERDDRNAKNLTVSVWTEIFKDKKKYLNCYYDEKSVKILEPNYAYYNIKLWTKFFMENNLYLQNEKFYISDLDKSVSFKTRDEFFLYVKKSDELRYINYEVKYEELLKVAADVYSKIKEKGDVYDKLNEKTKKLFENLKPKLEEIKAEQEKNDVFEGEDKEKVEENKETVVDKNENNNEENKAEDN